MHGFFKTSALYVAAWTFAAIFFATQSFVGYGQGRRTLSVAYVLIFALVDYYLWAALSLITIRLSKFAPFQKGKLAKAFAVHLPVGLFLAIFQLGLYSSITMSFEPLVGRTALLSYLRSGMMGAKLQLNLMIYWIVVGVHHGIRYYRESRQHETQALQLKARLAEAHLRALQSQLQPHFLFNTLNAISALMHRDVEAADRMLVRLSELLRIALDESGVQEVSLQRELEFIERYLDIEKERFGDRLQSRIDVAVGVRDCAVPILLLQPVVENAVRYAVASRECGGIVVLHAAVDADKLVIAVEDDGPGLPGNWREGVGLGNTRSRLDLLYGSAASMEFAAATRMGGLSVVIRIPMRRIGC